MHESTLPSNHATTPFVRLGASHGYCLEGDSAALNAEVDFAVGAGAPSHLALQLWACESPYQGGALSGVKVAETRLPVDGAPKLQVHDVAAFARPPADTREYAMVLVLAGDDNGQPQVFDFANYPRRQRFAAPHMEGHAGYQVLSDGQVELALERVQNPRATDNLSGTLALQLWAAQEPHAGGELKGTLVASAELGRLAGQAELTTGAVIAPLTPPPAGSTHALLALCEWTSQGYLVRDYRQVQTYGGPFQSEPSAPIAEVAREAPVAAAVSAETVPAANLAPNKARPERPSLNEVSEADLAKAAGLQKKLASDLVRARPFKSFQDVLKVRGIGERTVQRLRGLFSL